MFELRALQQGAREFRLRRLEHRLGLGYIQIGRDAALASILRQFERFLENLNIRSEQRRLGVEGVQRKIVRGHFGLNLQLDRLQIIEAGLFLGP